MSVATQRYPISTEALIDQLRSEAIPSALLLDVNDPRGVALLTWSEDPNFFACRVRSMLDCTYAPGHEPNLEHWLFDIPLE